VVALGVLVGGCGDAALRSTRYKAERLLWQAQRAEARVNLGADKPDSAALLTVRQEYLRVRREVAIPREAGTPDSTEVIRRDIARTVVTAQLQAARLAVLAGLADTALQDLSVIASMAGRDTLLLRQADFHRVAVYRQFRRTDEAIALLREMVGRYEPKPPVGGNEDAILAIPDGIVKMLRREGDEEGARLAASEAMQYYQMLLTRSYPASLEAQIRARLIRMELERGDWENGMRNLEELKRLAETSPELEGIKPELNYSEAKLVAIREGARSPRAIAMLDRFVQDYPQSAFAPRAIFEAGTLLEAQGKKREAVEKYKLVGERYPNERETAPLALFRRAMLEEQLGDWDLSKNLLESIPLRYPESQAAIQAPIAVARRYYRVGNLEAGKAALRRAIGTYEELITRDSTATYGPFYRWAILQCNVTLEDRTAALRTVDEMVKVNKGHPFTAQALLEGARVALQTKNQERARIYLRQFLADYPNSPLVDKVREDLKKLGPTSQQ
jgi:TolA-binding protein